MMYLELLLRVSNNPKDDSREYSAYTVPLHYAWQEGPDDLHLAFGKDRDQFHPHLDKKTGDYIVPDPEGRGTRYAYHLGFRPTPAKNKKQRLGRNYIKRLEALWYSPNRSKNPGPPKLPTWNALC